jgi:hypothetical protein
MGLLDWLADSFSGSGSEGTPMQPGPGAFMGDLDPMGNPTGQMMPMPAAAPAPTGPMPPVQQTGPDMPYPPGLDPMAGSGSGNDPGLPYPTGGDPMTAGGDMPNGPGLGMPPGIPMPQPRPPGANAALPPAAAPTGGAGMPPGADVASAVRSYQGAGGNFGPPGEASHLNRPVDRREPGGFSLLRAMGLDANTADRVRGTLAAGFKAAGESAGKSPGQAFSSGVGAGIEGGKKADDATTDRQQKYLAQAIAAKRAGDTNAYNVNYLSYLKEKAANELEVAKEKAASKDGKASVVNSQEQLYLRAQTATSQDPGIKASANTVREAQKQYGVDSKEAKAAMEAHEARIKQVRDGHLGQLGIDPAKIGDFSSKPGFSEKNPVKDFPKDPAAAQKAFDALPEGAYFINPKDGRLLMKKGAGSAPATNPSQPVTAPGAPQAPLPPALATANAGDEDDAV